MRPVVRLLTGLSLLVSLESVATARDVHIPLPPPSEFVRLIDNEFFPLKPGTTFFYEGQKEGVPTTSVFAVTHEKKVILGVKCTVIHDQAFEEGVLVEDTIDWLAQDRDGNVWYFGEDAKELDPNGNVISTEGSWQAGVDGAAPGIVMLAKPHVGDHYFQEVAPGVAEDQANVLSLRESACIGLGCFDDLLLTKEFTRLAPGVVEHKFYARGVGLILGVKVKGGNESSELVGITTEDKHGH
jgi:hypothetical protein